MRTHAQCARMHRTYAPNGRWRMCACLHTEASGLMFVRTDLCVSHTCTHTHTCVLANYKPINTLWKEDGRPPLAVSSLFVLPQNYCVFAWGKFLLEGMEEEGGRSGAFRRRRKYAEIGVFLKSTTYIHHSPFLMNTIAQNQLRNLFLKPINNLLVIGFIPLDAFRRAPHVVRALCVWTFVLSRKRWLRTLIGCESLLLYKK